MCDRKWLQHIVSIVKESVRRTCSALCVERMYVYLVRTRWIVSAHIVRRKVFVKDAQDGVFWTDAKTLRVGIVFCPKNGQNTIPVINTMMRESVCVNIIKTRNRVRNVIKTRATILPICAVVGK